MLFTKMPFTLCILFFISIVIQSSLGVHVNTFLTEEDKSRFKELLAIKTPLTAVPQEDLPALFYSLSGLAILHNGNINMVVPPKDQQTLCHSLKKAIEGAKDVESIYFGTSAAKLLLCSPVSLPSSSLSLLEAVNDVGVPTGSELIGTNIQLIHRNVASLKNLNRTIDSTKIGKILQSFLKSDSSLLSTGLILQTAALLSGQSNISPFFDRISDTIAKADEVDGKMLQFEGGLGVTSAIFRGIYSLADAAGKPPPITEAQVIKFTNYFLNRRSVQTAKGASELLEVLSLLTNNKYHIPLSISRFGSPFVSVENSVLSVKVCNVLGKSIGGFSVSAESPAWTGKRVMKPVTGDSTLFAENVFDSNPSKGEYKVTVTVKPAKEDKKIIAGVGELTMIVQTKVTIESAEIVIANKDQFSPQFTPLKYPSSMPSSLEGDNHQKLILKFFLNDSLKGQVLSAHQVFIRFIETSTQDEIIFVTEPNDSTKEHRFEVNFSLRTKDFNSRSGSYELYLIVGDVLFSNPLEWKIGTINLSFSTEESRDSSSVKSFYQPKPEIRHLFRQPEKRPATFVSDLFSILVLLPLLLLLVSWWGIGVNVRNMPLSLSTLCFHSGLALIFSLFFLFWLKMDMFTTLKCLSGVAVMTFLSGHSLLKILSKARKEH